MKTFKLNNVEVSVEDIRKLVRDNPDLLKPEVKGRYFFPKEGENTYYYINAGGDVVQVISNCLLSNDKAVLMGVFHTKEEAKLASEKQQAIVACWKWAQEKAPFEPDWGDYSQAKNYAYYSTRFGRVGFTIEFYSKSQFTLPYFKSVEDVENFITANKENLELLFTK